MEAIDGRDNGYPVKRRRTGERVEALKPATYSAPCNGANDASPDLDPDTFGSDTDASESKLDTDGPTELESALPHLDQGKDAIVDYEAMQSFEKDINIPKDLGDSLSTQKLTGGRRSIYVDAFNLALETVLDEENHLFDERERNIFDDWRGLGYEAQYLYVRLFLRKTSAWHRTSRLGYYSDISDISAAIESLQSCRPLGRVMEAVPVTGVKIEDTDSHFTGNSFAFADALTEDTTTLEEVSSLLSLDELKSISKEAKIRGKNKTELLGALRRMSRAQSGLGSVGLRILKSKSDPEIISEPSISNIPHISAEGKGSHGFRPDQSATLSNGNVKLSDLAFGDSNRDKHFVLKILNNIGSCIRLSSSTLRLFERVHMVYYRSTRWTEKSLTAIILARIQKRNFPNYLISRSANIFPSRAMLLEFEASIRLQHQVDTILENGMQDKQVQEEVLSIFEVVYPKWQALIADEQHKEDRVYESGEGAYLRLFSPCSVYTRILFKATLVFGRRKMYEREHSVLTELLEQRLFIYRRGGMYQRKALLEEHYLAEAGAGSKQTAGMTQDQLKRYWKRSSLKTAEEGLQDPDCHVIYHYDLEKRITKLEKAIKIPKREQHDFGHTRLMTPIERNVEGIQVRVIPSDVGRAGAEERRGQKTIWVDEKDGGECSVEAMCLSWYRRQGWKGYHAEGGILQTLFAYLFFDILFAYIPNVFQTAFQTCPLDLYTEAFFPSRASEIHHRLAELSNGGAGRLIREINERERDRRTCVVGLNWDFAVDDLLEIAACFDGSAMAGICKVMAQDYRQRGGGVPDLFLWNPETSQVMFSEVKSENDRLSDTQRLWIHVLMGSGVRVELCNAVAREVRTREE